MNEYARIKHIQTQLKAEIQGLLLSKGIHASEIQKMDGSPLKGVTRQHVHNAVNCNLPHIKLSEKLRDWLLSLPTVKSKKTAVIIQARMGSTRLPGKVMLPLSGKPALQCLIERIRVSKKIDQIIVATTENPKDHEISELCLSLDVPYFEGSEEDVLGRVTEAAKLFSVDVIVDITADCPLIHGGLIDLMIEEFKGGYLSNALPDRMAPDGLDVQIYDIESMQKANKQVADVLYRRHSGWNISNIPGVRKEIYFDEVYFRRAGLRLTLDTLEDYIVINRVFENFKEDPLFTPYQLFQFIGQNPESIELNQSITPKIAGEG